MKMRIASIPHIVDIEPLATVSPSKYTSLKNGCVYSHLAEKSLGRPSSDGLGLTMPPVSTANIIGTIIHGIFESVSKGLLANDEDSITAEWEKQCDIHRKRVESRFPSLRNFSVVDYDAMFDTIDIARAMGRKESSSPKSGAVFGLNEHRVEIPGLVHGAIDRIRPVAGAYDIIDYKTGKVFDDSGSIKQEYIDQLNLYAVMLEHSESVSVNGLFIVDRSGKEIPVPFLRDNTDRLLADVRGILADIKDSIADNAYDRLVNPNEQNCRFCPVQHVCRHRHAEQGAMFHIVDGIVSNIWNTDQLSLTTHSGKTVTVAKLGVLNIDGFDKLVGKRLVIVNLFCAIPDELYNRTDRTVVYERL